MPESNESRAARILEGATDEMVRDMIGREGDRFVAQLLLFKALRDGLPQYQVASFADYMAERFSLPEIRRQAGPMAEVDEEGFRLFREMATEGGAVRHFPANISAN